MPFTDDSARSQLQSNYSLAENWCSAFGATLPRIVNETDQKNIVGFIRSAARMYNFDSVQTIFVNHISDWSWVNGNKNKGNVTFLTLNQGRSYHWCSRCKAPGPTTSRG